MSSLLFKRLTPKVAPSTRALSRLTFNGRLVANPELRTTASGKEMVKFTVATNHGWKDDSPTSFWDVASFEHGPRRDYLLNIPKGSMVLVEADAQKVQYRDADGNHHTAVNLTHRNLEVLARYRPREELEMPPTEEQQEEQAAEAAA